MAGPRDKDLQQFLKGYSKETRQKYAEAIDRTTTQMAVRLRELGAGASLQEVQDAMFFVLYSNWTVNFTNKQKAVINRWVSRTYRHFRKDKSIFGRIEDDVQAGTFNVDDARTIEFYKRSDNFYLSKFITDDDTTKAINKFIREEYVEGRPRS